jgi:hypothetical protein
MAKKITGPPPSKGKRPPANAKKRDARDEFDEGVGKVFDAILARQREARERELFRVAVESLRTATPLERAEGVLRYWASRLDQWGDHEAVAYLISRGSDPSKYSRQIIANWREAENDSVQRVVGTSQSVWAQSVRQNPASVLSGFWSAGDSQWMSIEATMLRTNEWCGLAGFEPWWKQIAKNVQEGAFSGGSNLFFLFNMYRSEARDPSYEQ